MLVVFTKDLGILPEGKYINEDKIKSIDVRKLFDSALEEPITIYVVRNVGMLPISGLQKKSLILNGKFVYVNKGDIRNIIEQCDYERLLVLVPAGLDFIQYRREN